MQNIETMDSLLKNELSAVETYQQVFANFKDENDTRESAFLMPIYKGHKEAVSCLQNNIRELGVAPAASSVGGAWKKIIQGGIKIFGRQTTLIVLLEAEKCCAKDYEQVLRNHQLPLSTRCLIEWKLLLIQKSHARILNQHLDAMPA